MRWRKALRHKLLSLTDVRAVTGLDPDEILRRPDTQRLVRIDGNGLARSSSGSRSSFFAPTALRILGCRRDRD